MNLRETEAPRRGKSVRFTCIDCNRHFRLVSPATFFVDLDGPVVEWDLWCGPCGRARLARITPENPKGRRLAPAGAAP